MILRNFNDSKYSSIFSPCFSREREYQRCVIFFYRIDLNTSLTNCRLSLTEISVESRDVIDRSNSFRPYIEEQNRSDMFNYSRANDWR